MNEFKIKTGLLLGPSPTQPVTSIKDTSISITTDASSILVTGKAIYDFHQANLPDPVWGDIGGSLSNQTDLYNPWLVDLSTNAKKTFISLNDTPASYNPVDASPGMAVVINDTGDGLEFGPRIWRENANEVTLANEDADVLFYENIVIEADSGVGTFVDKSVTASSAGGTEESYTFDMDGNIIAKIYAQSDGAGSIQEQKFVSVAPFLAEASVYMSGIPEVSTGYVLYYNPATDQVTYAEASLGGGGGTVSDWGDIGGTLSDQTDLYNPWLVSSSTNISTNTTNISNKLDNTTDTFTGILTLDGSLSVGDILVSRDVQITGNLTVDGSIYSIGIETIDVSGAYIAMNTGFTGAPPASMQSGIIVARGTDDPYAILYDETKEQFRIGITTWNGTQYDDASTQAVATREDDPQDGGVSFWNNTENRFDTSTNFTTNGKDVSIGGVVYMPGLSEVSTGQVVYYNTTSGLLTYADASTSGGGSSYWTLDGSILRPTDETVNVELSAIQVNTDAGATTLVDMDVSSATTGTEESYAFNIDGSTIAKVYGKAVTGGTLSETGWVVETAQYMGDPNTNGSWRFYPDSNGDLVFEKRISGTWTEKGKFTE